ncbi:MAG: PIN domain-containing protein [Saprospiraceae bacterium]|nr:PIN domain-containing protein [Saprospiraceae bacterium]
MTLLFDTNILLHFLRESPLSKRVENELNPFDPSNTLLISVVTEGELRSLGFQNGWGKKRLEKLENELKDFAVVPIRSRDIIERYAELDAFSQGKLLGRPLGTSARNMGKNDLWIAATASILSAKLITMDSDFDHLNTVWIEMLKY